MDYILYGHILYAGVITIVTLVILIVFVNFLIVKFSFWTGSIISRIWAKTSNDHSPQNEENIEMEDIEMGNNKTETNQEPLRY